MKPSKDNCLATLLAAGTFGALALGAPSSASASLLFYDGFDYDTGVFTAAQSPGGWGIENSGGNLIINSGSLVYPDFPTSGNHASIIGGANSMHALPGSFDSGTLYFSYLTAFNNGNDTNRTLNVAFFAGTNERFAIGTRGPRGGNDGPDYLVPTGEFILLPANPQNTGGSVEVVQSANPIPYGPAVTLVVGKIEFNYDDSALDRISIFMNPDPSLSESPTPYIVSDTNDLGTLTNFRFFAGGNSGDLAAANGSFDEFRFGTTYAAVIPEPSTYALLFGALVLAGAGLRRRLR
jgi:hypothetical protein